MVGTGIALDATMRGAKVALVECADFGEGTSSRSTKIVHGGIRYLEKAFKQLSFAQLKLVFGALRERTTFLKTAPHLTDTAAFMIPCYKWWELPYFWLGVKFYDLLALEKNIEYSKFFLKSSTLRIYPQLKEERLKGSIVYYDGKMDDARMVVSLALTAAQEGASVANYVRVVSLIKDNDTNRVIGAACYDEVNGVAFDLYAKVVINATGPFSDQIRILSRGKSEFSPIIIPSSGSHIVIPQHFASRDVALLIPKTDDDRVVFLIPWMKKVVVGTTEKVENVAHRPEPTKDEVEWIINSISKYIKDVPTKEEILASWKGYRPLVSSLGKGESENLVRDYHFETDPNGLVTVVGGKWTSYRSMSESLVDMIDRRNGFNLGKCQTHIRAIIGGNNWSYNSVQKQLSEYSTTLMRDGKKYEIGLFDDRVIEHLARNYGTRASIVADIAKSGEYSNRLVPNYPYIEAEVVNAVENEWAQTVGDVIFRRFRLGFIDNKAAEIAVPKTAEIMGRLLGWSQKKIRREIDETYELLRDQNRNYL